MEKTYSNVDDCANLAKYLKNKMGKKIEFCGSVHQRVVCGKYFSHYREPHSDLEYLFEDGLPFYFKFCNNDFLRITIGSYPPFENSFGEKLAALSSFYEVLNEKFGEPIVFYTLKDDEEGALTLQWSFINKEKEIQDFKNGSYFDNGEIDNLIVFGEPVSQTCNYQLEDTTKKNNARTFGLPVELINLVVDNIEDFVKYKNGQELNIPKVYQDEYSEPQKKVFTKQ